MGKKTDMGDDVVGFGDFMCFAVYSTNLAYSRVYKPVLEQLGLTYPQYLTIICLWEENNQTVKGLSEKKRHDCHLESDVVDLLAHLRQRSFFGRSLPAYFAGVLALRMVASSI